MFLMRAWALVYNKSMKENNVVKIINKDGYSYLEFKKLTELGVKNCFTLKPLNFSFKHQSEEDNRSNFKLICKLMDINYDKLCRPEQKHTNEVKTVKDKYGINISEFSFTDGLITNQKGVPIATTAADCTPIIIYDPQNKVIANVHSGWKGTLNNIVINATNKMIQEFNCQKENLLYFFGPCICKDCFEVQNDVYELFYNKYKDLDNINDIIRKKNDKYLIDTTLLNETLLINMGIKKANIYKADICTYENDNYLHSYRKRTSESFGLGVAIVCL